MLEDPSYWKSSRACSKFKTLVSFFFLLILELKPNAY